MRSLGPALAVLTFVLAGCAVGTEDAKVDPAPEGAEADEQNAEPLPNFNQVRAGLYRGGRPNAAGFARLKTLGVKTIVDLEIGDFIEATPGSIDAEIATAKAQGFTHLRFPMSAFEAASSQRFDTLMSDLLAVLRDPTKGPIYVHCKHGQDRTGLVIGLERVLAEGWTPKAAHDEMLRIGFHTGFVGLENYFERKTGWSP